MERKRIFFMVWVFILLYTLSVKAQEVTTKDSLATKEPYATDSVALIPDSLYQDEPTIRPKESLTTGETQLATTDIQQLPPEPFELPKQFTAWYNNIPSSTKALIFAVVPGGGQLYNKKYWKAPIVWSIAAGCTYAISRFNSQYREYFTAYRDFMSENPMQYDSWKSFVPSGSDPKDFVGNGNIQGRLKQGTTENRRNRDFSIILSCFLYLLTLLDAYVDAEMVDYDISPNLSLWSPTISASQDPLISGPAVGIQCSIAF